VQLARLAELEKKKAPISAWEIGEVRALLQLANRAQEARARAIIERSQPTPKSPGQKAAEQRRSSGRGW
jgi:hypothetical protein